MILDCTLTRRTKSQAHHIRDACLPGREYLVRILCFVWNN